MFKSNVTSYHMLASHLTGWDPNPEQLFNYHGRSGSPADPTNTLHPAGQGSWAWGK